VSLEKVDTICYIGDMINADEGHDSAVMTAIISKSFGLSHEDAHVGRMETENQGKLANPGLPGK